MGILIWSHFQVLLFLLSLTYGYFRKIFMVLVNMGLYSPNVHSKLGDIWSHDALVMILKKLGKLRWPILNRAIYLSTQSLIH